MASHSAICSDCGDLEKQTYSKGLCKACYQRQWKASREQISTIGEVLDAYGEADSRPTVLDDGEDGPEAVEDPITTSPGERRPGWVGTPSSSRVAAGSERVQSSAENKIRNLFKKKEPKVTSGDGGSPPPTREKRPGGGKSSRRHSAAETIADGWSALGSVAIRTGSHAPLGRCMQWQAPMAGEMLDDAVKGTVIDKVALQRVVSARGRYDLLGAVFGPPLLVWAIERNPAQAQTLMPLLASSIRHSLPLMVPAIKKAQERERKVYEATELLFADDPNFQSGDDPVQYILAMMFEGWVPPEPVVPVEVPDAYASGPVA